MPDKGVVYVATVQTLYIEEAFVSAESVKRHCPDLSITLFTDQPGHHLCSTGVFDLVRPVTRALFVRAPWGEGQINRLRSLRLTPYAYTLHIDTDTLVLTPELQSIFKVLDRVEVAMVEDPEMYSYSRQKLHIPMFNGGLLLYKRNDRVMSFINEWLSLAESNAKKGAMAVLPEIPVLTGIANEVVRRRLLFNDQTALVQLFSPAVNRFGLNYEILDYCWNARELNDPFTGGRPVKIIHRHHDDRHAFMVQQALDRVADQKQPEKESPA